MEKGILLNHEIYNYLIKRDKELYDKLIGKADQNVYFYESFFLTLLIGYIDVELSSRILDIFFCCKLNSWN